jgi:hypothetical protein
MVKRTPKSQKLYRWRITRIRASPAALIGYVKAPNAEQAIRAAFAQRPEANRSRRYLPIDRVMSA